MGLTVSTYGVNNFTLWGHNFNLWCKPQGDSQDKTKGYEHPDVHPHLQGKHEPDCCINEPHTPHVGESPKRGMVTAAPETVEATDCVTDEGAGAGNAKRSSCSLEIPVLHPAPQIVHDALGIAHLLVPGPARRLESGVSEFFADGL